MAKPLDALEARFRSAASPDLPTLAWGVWHEGESWTGAVGATTRTPFSLASVTKPMTAHGVMRLVERGLVDLASPVSDYLEVPLDGDVEGATVGRVLDHTAGLPLHYQFFYADEPYAPPPFAETIRRYGKTFWAPGSRHVYSNLGYGLLARLIERVSGLPYADFMRKEVFEPLGMDHASIGASAGAAVPRGKGFDYPAYGFDHPGASAAFASVEDLLMFGRFHLDPGPPFLAMQAATAEVGPGRGYGLGWATDARGFVEHSGAMGGVRTILRLVPRLGLVVALVASGETGLVGLAADEAVAAMAPDFPPTTDRRAPPAGALDGFLGEWRGCVETYRGDVPFAFRLDETFEARGGRLRGVVDGDVGTEDAGRRPYRLHLDLAPIGDRLEGSVSAVTTPHEGERLGNALSYRCRLASVV